MSQGFIANILQSFIGLYSHLMNWSSQSIIFQAIDCWTVSDFKLAGLCKNEHNVSMVSIRALRVVQKSQNHRCRRCKSDFKKSSSWIIHFIDEKINSEEFINSEAQTLPMFLQQQGTRKGWREGSFIGSQSADIIVW